ncbi:MAG: Holliday junction resolvase RuvX [Calditrichaceae bacterium]|nr:Holliday junction resolvase RuvX [Calditrichaceae bacterium]
MDIQKKVLALDIGERRVGLAVSDELGMLAHPFRTLKWEGQKNFINTIKQIIEEEHIAKLVIGIPYNLNGSMSKKTEEIKKISDQIQDQLFIEVIEIDERLTTKMAKQVLHAVGKKPSKNRDKIDQVAAVYILQSYLDRLN